MKFVLRVNWLILLIWSAVIGFQLPLDSSSTHIIWTDFVILIGLLIVQLVCFFQVSRLYGFILVMLYTLALLTGLRTMLSIDLIFSWSGALVFVFEIALIVYLIGVRGYLRSNAGMQIMGIEPKASGSS